VRILGNALLVGGMLAGVWSIRLFTQDRSETGSKWLGVAIGMLAAGTLLQVL
jgi:hypothetical protein